MVIADIGKKYTQCVKHADSGVYTQCVYTGVGGNLKKQLTTKNIQENDTVTND